jgi:hypothetical protein
VAVALWPSMGSEVEVIEIKASARDFRAELAQPEKSAPFAAYASRRWFAVPAPWPSTVPSKSLVPRPWGLLSVGTGAPAVIVEAEPHEPAARLSGFELALLRAAVAVQGDQDADEPGGAARRLGAEGPQRSRSEPLFAALLPLGARRSQSGRGAAC